MQLDSQHAVITNTIDSIVTKGAQKLYQIYIKQKIPNHSTGQTAQIIQTNFCSMYRNLENKSTIMRDGMPKGALKEAIIPNKIQKQKINNHTITFGENLSFRQQETDKNVIKKGSMTQRTTQASPKKITSRIRQKIISNLKPILNPEYPISQQQEQLQIRKYKKNQQKKQQLNLQKQQKIQSQKSANRRRLQNKLLQLQGLGVPYSYDNQGNITSPDPSAYKYQKYQNQKAAKKDRMFNLKFNTIQMGNIQRYVKDIRSITGRKKGYFSSQFYKKIRMTNQQYNNKNFRQNTNIPYINLVQGIKVTQRQRNVIAEKMQSPTVHLSQYKQKTQQNFFKSFIPEFDLNLSLQTTSVDRPFTSANYNRTKRTVQTGTSGKQRNTRMKASILWRPHTSNKQCRMSINNEDLAKKVIQIED